MASNIDLDLAKLSQIMAIKPFKSKKEAVNEALSSYLNYLLSQQALALKGSKIWEGNLNEMRQDQASQPFLIRRFGSIYQRPFVYFAKRKLRCTGWLPK